MKSQLTLLLSLVLLPVIPARADGPAGNPAVRPAPVVPVERAPLARFSLDFPGGTATELVRAIEKAMGRTLNAIVPEKHAKVRLPALKMKDVDVPSLFTALYRASFSRDARFNQRVTSMSGFRTEGEISNDSVWYFTYEGDGFTTKVCRFFPLAPYLDGGLSVDDVTTAIQSGWRMLEEAEPPSLSYHKETRLLIAVGDPEMLKTIDMVLDALKDRRVYPQGPHSPEKMPENKQN